MPVVRRSPIHEIALNKNVRLAGERSVFALDSRLEKDTWFVGDLPLCRLLLSNDSNYPWFVLVPRQEGISELFQLDESSQARMWSETTGVSRILGGVFNAHKMNVATLGNVVSQLHMHVIVRYQTDAAWPAPVWGQHPARPYTEEQVNAIRRQVADALKSEFSFSEVLS